MKKLVHFLLMLAIAFPSLAYQVGELIPVGSKKAISLPFRDPTDSQSGASFIGSPYSEGRGNIGAVYRFDSNLVKLIPAKDFRSGDEIEANRIAGELGVGPKVFNAWVTHKKDDLNHQLYVAIEMEGLPGTTLGSVIPQRTRGKDYGELRELQKIYQNRNRNFGDGNTYFFDRFFTILKLLAEHKVSWADAHYGNFIHPALISFGNELKIIDFDSAEIHEDSAAAARAILTAPYIRPWVEMFNRLPDSDKGEKAKAALNALQEMTGIPH